MDKAHFSEPVHEQANSRTGRADDLSQCLLADLWNHRLRLTVLPEIGQKKEHPCQPLFAGVEELVHQILLNPNIAGEQMMKQQIRERWLFMKHADHARFLKPHDRTL